MEHIKKESLKYSTYTNLYLFNVVSKLPGGKILDVGCNSGNFGEQLINKKREVWGIDYSEEVISEAKKKLSRAIVFDLESYSIPFPNEKFDIIVFADVLEHIRYPDIILRKFTSMLNEGGVVVASLPNVANINIRLSLFLGKWKYKRSGILDRTHLKFFTRRTVKELFKSSGYEIITVDSTPGFNFIFLRYFTFLKKMAQFACRTYPKLFALQFIVIGKKDE